MQVLNPKAVRLVTDHFWWLGECANAKRRLN